MRKKIMFLTIIMLLFIPIKAYADSPTVEVKVDGKVKKGEEINILVNAKDLQGLYAASVNFIYDKNILNILEITPGETIKKHSNEIMEIGGEVDSDNNKTSYSFTFLGDKNGISENLTVATIKAKVLSDDNLSIGEDSLEVKLVKRSGDTVDNYEYKFIGYNTETTKPNTGENQNTSNSGGSSSEITSSNSTTSNNNSNINNNKQEINNSNSNNNSSSSSNTSTNKENNNDEEITSEATNENNNSSTSDKNKLDTSKDKNEESLDNDKEKGSDNKTIENSNSKNSLLIAFLLIILGVLIVAIYNYRKKICSNK